jgi:LysR family nitrogen assimilation transcriptional regulator
MHSWLDLRRLQYFLTIVEQGSFSAASRHLGVAQPALTHHIREIERSIGTPLLLRSKSGVVPTEAGEVLLEHARGIVARMEEAKHAMMRFRQPVKDVQRIIRIAAISSLSPAIAARLIPAARARLPAVRIHIVEMSATEIYRLVESGQIDFAITLKEEGWPGGERVGTEELLFVGAPRSDVSASEPIMLHDVLSDSLILPSATSVLRRSIEALAREYGKGLKIALEVDGISPRKEAVVAGLGTTLLPFASIGYELALGTLQARRIQPPLVRDLVLQKRRDEDGADAEVLANIIRDILGDITEIKGL